MQEKRDKKKRNHWIQFQVKSGVTLRKRIHCEHTGFSATVWLHIAITY